MRLLLCIVILFSVLKVAGQENLVINGSFEIIESCDLDYGYLELAIPWFCLSNYIYGCNLFNDCSSFPNVLVPENYIGIQNPNTGNGYAGLITSSDGYSEALGCPLSGKLIADSVYHITMSVSLADESQWSTRDLGIGFMDSAYTFPDVQLSELPLALIEPEPIIEKDEWVQLDTLYTANGTESHIAIGYFRGYSGLDSITGLSGQYVGSYYYIDDVVVRKATQTDINNLRYNVLDFGLYPNPANEVLRLSSKARLSRVLIRDVHGTLVQEAKLDGTDNELQVSGLPAGVYLIEAYAENGKRGVQRFVKLSDR